VSDDRFASQVSPCELQWSPRLSFSDVPATTALQQARGRLWADGAWTARGGGDGGAASVTARGFELRFRSAGWGMI
jgi:hypothetical protein